MDDSDYDGRLRVDRTLPVKSGETIKYHGDRLLAQLFEVHAHPRSDIPRELIKQELKQN